MLKITTGLALPGDVTLNCHKLNPKSPHVEGPSVPSLQSHPAPNSLEPCLMKLSEPSILAIWL